MTSQTDNSPIILSALCLAAIIIPDQERKDFYKNIMLTFEKVLPKDITQKTMDMVDNAADYLKATLALMKDAPSSTDKKEFIKFAINTMPKETQKILHLTIPLITQELQDLQLFDVDETETIQ